MTARLIGKSDPAPRPWMPRKRTSCHIVCDRPERSDPKRKMLTPIISIGRRPNWSESFP